MQLPSRRLGTEGISPKPQDGHVDLLRSLDGTRPESPVFDRSGASGAEVLGLVFNVSSCGALLEVDDQLTKNREPEEEPTA